MWVIRPSWTVKAMTEYGAPPRTVRVPAVPLTERAGDVSALRKSSAWPATRAEPRDRGRLRASRRHRRTAGRRPGRAPRRGRRSRRRGRRRGTRRRPARWRAVSASRHRAAPCTRRRARLASWRAASGERPTIGAISSNGTANMSCSTKASRSAGASVSSTTSSASADRVGQQRLAARGRRRRALDDRVGHARPSSGLLAPRSCASRSMSRHTRAETVVSQPPQVVDLARVGAAEAQPRLLHGVVGLARASRASGRPPPAAGRGAPRNAPPAGWRPARTRALVLSRHSSKGSHFHDVPHPKEVTVPHPGVPLPLTGCPRARRRLPRSRGGCRLRRAVPRLPPVWGALAVNGALQGRGELRDKPRRWRTGPAGPAPYGGNPDHRPVAVVAQFPRPWWGTLARGGATFFMGAGGTPGRSLGVGAPPSRQAGGELRDKPRRWRTGPAGPAPYRGNPDHRPVAGCPRSSSRP